MQRLKPYKIILALAVMIAGGICMLLPVKNAVPVASMGGVMKSSPSSADTLPDVSSDTVSVE